MKWNIHKIYDLIVRTTIMAFLIEFLKYIGEKREIEEVLKGDINTLNGSTLYLDFLCRLKDGTVCHIEFQFPVAYSHDLKRFFRYNITAEITYDGITETIVFNFSRSNKGDVKIKIGDSKDFHPKIFYLGDIDFEKELEKIHIRLNLARLENIISNENINIQLTYKEELHLVLMSLSERYKDKKILLKQAVELLKNEKLFHKEKINIIKSIIKLEIENLVPKEEQEELKGELKMTDNEEDLMIESAKYIHKKYEQEAINEAEKRGKEKGKEEGIEKVARNLKSLLTPEEISKVTGLSISTILLL